MAAKDLNRQSGIDFKDVQLIIYDFDGVMTDNRALIFDDGREAVYVNRSDGLAVGAIRRRGIKQVIVSTETNCIASIRAKKLGIPCIQSVADKKKTVEQYLKENDIAPSKTIFIGNDLNDLEAMKYVGLPIAPFDAHKAVSHISKITLRSKGGYGVVRELLDLLGLGDKNG
jgi:3-deoxy-D-manno-octulosonate 8-phosphate phosphatase (KDO 8-P phosphatase)